MESTTPRNTLRIFQTHDASGHESVAEFTHTVTHKTANTLGSDAMLFLAPLNPQETGEAGVFLYSDPARGSGWLRLENFSRTDAERIQELVRMEAIARVVGKEPLRNADLSIGSAVALRSNNPWVIIGFGIVLLGLAIALFVGAPADWSQSPTYPIMGSVFGVLAIAMFITAGIRVPWWHRARAHSRDHYGELPHDLKGL